MTKENNILWDEFNNELFDKTTNIGRLIILRRLIVSTWQMDKKYKSVEDVLKDLNEMFIKYGYILKK